MAWLFSRPETITPAYVADESTTTVDDEPITETPYTGCAWCGDGEGCCSMHAAQMAAQADEYHAKRGRRS